MQQTIEQVLRQLNISFTSYQHPPLHSCEDADKYNLQRSGFRLKNLFLRDNYGKKHLLLLVPHDCQIALKSLAKQLGVSRLGFASARRLQTYLGCEPGHLSLLALINDCDHKVDLYIDSKVWNQSQLQCHPLDNRFTYVFTKKDVEKILRFTGHRPHIIDVPILL